MTSDKIAQAEQYAEYSLLLWLLERSGDAVYDWILCHAIVNGWNKETTDDFRRAFLVVSCNPVSTNAYVDKVLEDYSRDLFERCLVY